ncbi:MAG: hypothetical protein H8D67_30915 [Deltaproteobacteria bacterium]|nr:hypothetical protein [Deltaproteobacteria bacterium]
MKNDPMTILITIGKDAGYTVLVSKPKFGSPDRSLYACEGVKSLLDRLIRVLGLWLKYEITIKEL